jgi:SAM-dependent methyltransferase
MDEITRANKAHHAAVFERHGATAKGVGWTSEEEVLVRYDKMLAVTQKDFAVLPETPSFLDVGCGWGGQLRRARARGIDIKYTGIDIVEEMIAHARKEFTEAEFILGDVFEMDRPAAYDFVVCNAILTQKLSATIPAMEAFSRRLIRKMFELSRHGIAFNMMSTRVDFMADNLYYQNPADLLHWMLTDLTPRVRLDHGYSSLGGGTGKFYDFTVFAYKN